MSPLTDPRSLHARVVDAFALTATQAGMLFHALHHEPGQGIDIQQISMTVQHPLDPALYVYAWYSVMERHPVLRSRLRWEGLDEPRQEVMDAVELPVERADWRGQEPAEIRARLLAVAERDRAQGFDLSQPPLMRLHMARVGECAWSILWTFHHVLMDGRSFPQVLRESFEIHDSLRLRREVLLPPAIAYRNGLPDPAEIDEIASERYWRRLLDGVQGPTPLGIDLSPGAGMRQPPGSRFGARQRSLSLDATMALRERAKLAGLSLNTLLIGAWAVMLQRCGNSRDIVVGTTRSHRHLLPDPGAACVGLHIHTVPMRIDADPDRPIDDWLADIRAQQMAMRPHELTPLARIQSWVGLPPGTPLFETLVVYDHASLGERMQAWGPPWDLRRFDHVGQTGYPLALVAYGDPQLLLRLEYDRRRFSDGLMERLLGHLETLLRGLAEDRCERLGDLPWLTEPERQSLIGPPPPVFPEAPPLHRQFEQHAARTPHAPALTVVDEQGQRSEWSYAQLNRCANRLAHRLREAGVGRNRLVGLRAERGADAVVGLLAILKAGGAYLPLDPVYPLERAAYMLDDAEVEWLLVSPSLADEWAQAALQRCVIDADPAIDPHDPDGADLPPVNASADLAYVIYTSGSTGQPKGVQITHANVARLFAATQADYRFDDRDVWTLFHSYSFDFSVWELWGALLHGGRLVTIPMGLSRDVEAFCELLVRERVTVLNQTPTAFRRLVDVACDGPVRAFSLRYVVFGGEALELQMLRPWFERYGDARPQLVNMYGITETTVHVSYRPLQAADLTEASGSVIGEPITDLKILLLDEQGRLVPRGVPGEIAVAGGGVGLGYLRRPDLTAQRFVPDPFDAASGARLYLSGDLARWLDNGDLEYLGRRDQQVKIRGFRIELGEIEAAIGRHPHVRQVAVVAREDSPGDKRLVAYVVPALLGQGVREGASEPELALQLRALLRERLPEYMVPAHVLCIDELPLTGNGKLDTRALPAPHEHRPLTAAPESRALTPTEAALARIWASVLRIEQVGPDQHFFELGGDSILSIQIVARSRQAGLKVQLKDLFECPTVAALARRIDALGAAAPSSGVAATSAVTAPRAPAAQAEPERAAPRAASELPAVAAEPPARSPVNRRMEPPPIPVAPRPVPVAAGSAPVAAVAVPSRPVPASLPDASPAATAVRHESQPGPLMPIQRWFFDQSFRDADHWNQAFWFTVPPRVEPLQLAEAWRAVQQAHPSLRERYGRDAEGRWSVVAIAAADEPPLVHVDLTGLDADTARARMEERAQEAQAGLDIVRGPLVRLLHVTRTPPEPSRLLVVIHHLAVDGVSWRVIREDLEAALEAVLDEQAVPLPEPTTSIHDWAAALQRAASDPQLLATASHWLQVSSRAPWQAPLPPHAVTPGPVVHRRQLTSDLTRLLLQQLPVRYGVSLQAGLLTALAGALHAMTSADAWRIDLEGHGREPIDDALDVSRTVGWFTSLFPFVLEHDPRTDADPADALPSMQGRWDAVPTRGLGYGVLRWLSGDAALRDALARAPSAPLLFNYLGQFDAVVADSHWFGFAEESTGSWRSPAAHRSHALEIVAQIRHGQLMLVAEHDAAGVDAAWAGSLLDAFVAGLQAQVASLRRAAGETAEAPIPLPRRWPPSGPAPLDAVADTAEVAAVPVVSAVARAAAATVAEPVVAPVAASAPAAPHATAALPEPPSEPVARRAEPAQPAAPEAMTADAAPSPSPAPSPAEAADPVDGASGDEPYPLTPMQRLFFAMDDARPELGLEQWQFRLEGPLNPTRLRRALSRVVERHEVLRAAFLPGPEGQPVQQPQAVTDVPWRDDDWRTMGAVEQERRLATLLQTDREQRFDLRRPPLMRVLLLRRGDDLWHLVWTTHHLTLDGWSWPLVLAEWSRAYAALESGLAPNEPPAVSYRRYVQALPGLIEGSDAFWRRHLAGLEAPTPLVSPDAPAGDAAPGLREWLGTVPEEGAAALVTRARRWRLTPGTLVYAAWACVLAHRAAARHVAFGATLAGRPPEWPGIEHLVGPCVNNVPVRVAVPPDQPLAAWLSSLQALQFDLSQHQYLPLEQIQQVSQVPWHQRLFDSLVVFQNYQVDPDARRIGPQVSCQLLAAPEATNFPLTLTVTTGPAWRLRWLSGSSSISQDTLRVLDASLAQVLAAFCDDGIETVGDVLAALPPEGRGCAMPRAVVATEPARGPVAVPSAAPAFGSGPAPTAREAELAALWAELLGRPEVPLDTNFFDMGVHSLLLVRAHRVIQERLGVTLPLLALVRHPTIRGLARWLDDDGDGHDDGVADAARDRVRRLRLAQQRQRLGAYGRRSVP